MTVVSIKSMAEREGIYSVLESLGTDTEISIPLYEDFIILPIEELNLNVRSFNGLKRAKIDTIGSLAKTITSESGLSNIRNLGRKSIREICEALLNECYARLSDAEKDQFIYETLRGSMK